MGLGVSNESLEGFVVVCVPGISRLLVRESKRSSKKDYLVRAWVCGSGFRAPIRISSSDVGVSENRGTFFWGLYNKDRTIEGTIFGFPIFGNSHMAMWFCSHAL